MILLKLNFDNGSDKGLMAMAATDRPPRSARDTLMASQKAMKAIRGAAINVYTFLAMASPGSSSQAERRRLAYRTFVARHFTF